MSSSSTSNNTIKVWYLTEDKENIQVISIKKFTSFKPDICNLLNCRTVEYQGFTDNSTGIQYGILMNEMGLYEDKVFNSCARKILGKIKLMWGTFTGKYLIYSYKFNEETETEEQLDMDLTPKEFIEKFNKAICRK